MNQLQNIGVFINSYRYSFHGMESDDEVKGTKNSYTTEYRQYDPRVGRWLSIDPKSNAVHSPYSGMANNPIWFNDKDGDTIKVTNNAGDYLFTLDWGGEEVFTMSAKNLYDDFGFQWWEPEAYDYVPLLDVADDISVNESLKHFTWDEVMDFAQIRRNDYTYRGGGSGDWKKASDGADGYFLVTVDGMPYWADGIGQIPFAVDVYKDYLIDDGSHTKARENMMKAGYEHHSGALFGGGSDSRATYDNLMIARVAKWMLLNYSVTGGAVIDYNIRMNSDANYSDLGNPLSSSDATYYRGDSNPSPPVSIDGVKKNKYFKYSLRGGFQSGREYLEEKKGN